MQEGSFYKFCISACIFMILISLSLNFIIILDVFHTEIPTPILNQTTGNITKIAGGDFLSVILDNFSILLSLEAAIGGTIAVILVVAAMRTGSWNIVAAYLFGAVFWISWSNSIAFLLTAGNFFNSPAMAALILMITVVMSFIFVGAILGLLGGTE